MENIKIIDSEQVRSINNYQHTEYKLLKTNATECFTRTCVTERYIKIKDVLLVGILNKCLIQNLAIFELLITISGRIAAQSEKRSQNTSQSL